VNFYLGEKIILLKIIGIVLWKKIGNLNNEFNNLILDKNEDEINKIKEDILNKCMEIVKIENKKFYDEKIKNYEKFKNTDIENKQSIGKLKKILFFRTQ